ncbi:hypothetical protein L3Q65_00500 (plasmid) [Amycolatopsis sp. FU40]|uniref:hypothetical protein n=1 Tax=Amycolatopsis sp. FU40 TaxID=2914159 RepID=UPI001F3050C9|nr:hypothetical protein [Amycolatopsis sp. FU40]UKD50808.1 hypothetical protein L3Q65_00500 [Amycolatopsis sp. FU40]
MSGLPTLPVWQRFHTDAGVTHEALDAAGRAWRLWFEPQGTPGSPLPAGWRFAPLDALDQTGFIEHRGGARELDIAAVRITALCLRKARDLPAG